jgi:hypothetical protein
MSFLRPAVGHKFDVVNENGRVLATGTLQVELKAGAQRHGATVFVSDEHTAELPSLNGLDYDALAQAQAGQ